MEPPAHAEVALLSGPAQRPFVDGARVGYCHIGGRVELSAFPEVATPSCVNQQVIHHHARWRFKNASRRQLSVAIHAATGIFAVSAYGSQSTAVSPNVA